MILVVDTSSSRSALSLIDPERRGCVDETFGSREPGPSLGARLRGLVEDPRRLTKVAVATGPGSFTGLRKGASFAVGLAMGLRIPIVPLPTLELQLATGRGRFTAVVEAGQGRFYHLAPGGMPALGGPDEIPKDRWLVGLLAAATQSLLEQRGHRMAGPKDVRPVCGAAEELLKSAHEVGYGDVKLEYMHSFGLGDGR